MKPLPPSGNSKAWQPTPPGSLADKLANLAPGELAGLWARARAARSAQLDAEHERMMAAVAAREQADSQPK